MMKTVFRENFSPVLFLHSDRMVKIRKMICQGLCKKIGEWENLRMGEPVSDFYRANIRLAIINERQ